MFTIKVDDEISLHLIQEHHHRDLFNIIDSNRAYFEKYLGQMDKDIEETRQNCLMSKKLFAERGDIVTAIMYQGEPAGLISLRDRSGGTVNGAEIGYWLGEEHVGKGIVTHATRTLTDYAFTHMGFERVFLGIAPDNRRSCAVAERLDFTLEGTIRHNTKINEQWIDHRLYNMLKSDWTMSQNPPILSYQLDDKLNLRLIEKRHAQELYDLCDANREHIGEFLSWIDDTKSVDDTMGFIKESLKQYGENNGWQAGIWHDNQLVGMIGYLEWNYINWHTEIGYWLAESATGQGIMTRCTRELTRYAIETLKLNRVVIRCAVDNKPSAAVAERLGYTHERIERQGIKLRDTYTDVHVYSLLAEDWQKQ